MRLIRAAGQNVSPSDDGRLYDQIFSDGLFTDTAFAMLGTNNVQIGAMYGDLCGRDFTIEQQTIAVALPEGDGEVTGYIFVEIDTTAETPLSVGSALAPFTPTYDDINVNGAVAQMIVAEYTADAVSVTSVTPVYDKASAGAVQPGSVATVEKSPATAPHSVGEYILVSGVLYRVTSAISTGETISPGINVIAEPIGDALSELKSGLIYENFTSKVTANETFNTLTFERIGNVVTFSIMGQNNKTRAENQLICTIPEGYRPKKNYKYVGTIGTSVPCVYDLETNGKFTIYAAASYPSQRVYVSGSYVIG